MKAILSLGLFMVLVGTIWADFNPLDYVMTKDIVFERNYNSYSLSNQTETLRVNLDLSLNSGSNWHKRIAHGIPAEWGTNVYTYNLRVTPDIWTDHARVGLRTLWASTTNAILFHHGDMSASDFAIKGIRFINPVNNETVWQPSYKTFRWHEAGFDAVTLGYSTNAGAGWIPLYRLASPNRTNTYSLAITGFPTGRVDFIMWGASDIYHTVTLKIRSN